MTASATTAALLERCFFPPAGEPLECAVSGGPDSMALLGLAVAAGCRTTAYHVDHHLRPGSDKEARLVESAARALGAEFVSLEVVVEPGPNLEARARSARYGVLPASVATGHTADDQAETLLLNLLRGAGRTGLAAMRPGRARPLLCLRRSETAAYTEALGLGVVDDESNRDPRFRRNRVRRELLPLASEIAGRDVVPILCRVANLMRDESDLLDGLASAIDPMDVFALRRTPHALARRALRQMIAASSSDHYPPDAAAIERVLSVANGATRAAEVAGGLRIRRSAGRLHIEQPPPRGSKPERDDG